MNRIAILLAAGVALAIVAPFLVLAIRVAIGIRQANSTRGEPLVCPACGRADVRPSFPSGRTDALLIGCGRLPFRCRACNFRFYRLRQDCDNLESAQSDAQEIPSA